MTIPFLFFALLFSPFISAAMEEFEPSGAPGSRYIEPLAKFAGKIIPAPALSCSISALKDIAGLSEYRGNGFGIGDTNEGFAAFLNRELEKNQCLGERLWKFWGEIEKEFPSNPEGHDLSEEKTDPPPSLAEEAGKGRYEQVKPGWLWQRAMKEAKNDPYYASMLIAFCTHDDTNNLPNSVTISNEIYAPIWEAKIANVKKYLLQLERKIKLAADESPEMVAAKATMKRQKKYLAELIQKQAEKATGKERIKCPQAFSPVFAPKSLSPEADISPELKAAIARSQAPTKGAAALSSKTYHYNLSAYLGCKLAQCGLSPETASKVTGFVGRIYRVMRFLDEGDTAGDIRAATALLESEADRLEMNSDDPQFPKKAQVTPAQLAKADAAKLEARLGMFHDAISEQVDPMKDKKLWPHGRPPNGTLCQIPGWSVERCDAARAKLLTWRMDLVWTEAQHQIGGKFGANQCKSLPVRPKAPMDYCQKTKAGPVRYETSAPDSPGSEEGISAR